MRKFSIATAMMLILILVCSCANNNGSMSTSEPTVKAQKTSTPEPVVATDNVIVAEIEMQTGDVIKLDLYPDVAPITVQNFVKLANDGFYDGLIFHRVISGFMVQGGGYDVNMAERSADSIKGEFSANGVSNGLKHERGVISMARTSLSMDSASSQFFIMHSAAPHLDGQYAAFGKVTEGMDTVDAIASAKTATVGNMADVPVEAQVIKSVTIK